MYHHGTLRTPQFFVCIRLPSLAFACAIHRALSLPPFRLCHSQRLPLHSSRPNCFRPGVPSFHCCARHSCQLVRPTCVLCTTFTCVEPMCVCVYKQRQHCNARRRSGWQSAPEPPARPRTRPSSWHPRRPAPAAAPPPPAARAAGRRRPGRACTGVGRQARWAGRAGWVRKTNRQGLSTQKECTTRRTRLVCSSPRPQANRIE